MFNAMQQSEMDFIPEPPVLMRSKNLQQIQAMIANAKQLPSRVYSEVRGDHTFYLVRRIRTRMCAYDYQYVTIRHIGGVPHRRVEYVNDESPDADVL
jgi:hypothetical protein